MKYVQVFRLAPVSVFSDVIERVSVRGFGDRSAKERRLAKSFISPRVLNQIPQNEVAWNLVFILTLFQPGGRGGIHPPPGFSLAIATKINRSTPNFLTFNFYYRDIIWTKIKFITCQGVTSSLFCRKHFVSPHIFHYIFTEFSCSTFSFF